MLPRRQARLRVHPLEPKAFETIRKPGKVLVRWHITLFTSRMGFAKFNSNPCFFPTAFGMRLYNGKMNIFQALDRLPGQRPSSSTTIVLSTSKKIGAVCRPTSTSPYSFLDFSWFPDFLIAKLQVSSASSGYPREIARNRFSYNRQNSHSSPWAKPPTCSGTASSRRVSPVTGVNERDVPQIKVTCSLRNDPV